MTKIYNARGTPKTIQDNQFNLELYSAAANTEGVGIQLPGRNVTNYGGPIAQNFLQLTENFAGPNAPAADKSTLGQIWFNTTDNSLYVKTNVTTETIPNWSKILNSGAGAGKKQRITAKLGQTGTGVVVPFWTVAMGYEVNSYTEISNITMPNTGTVSLSFAFGFQPGSLSTFPAYTHVISSAYVVNSRLIGTGNDGNVGSFYGSTMYCPGGANNTGILNSIHGAINYLPVMAGDILSIKSTIWNLPYTSGPHADWVTADNNGESFFGYNYVG